jgi:hypothetical protein
MSVLQWVMVVGWPLLIVEFVLFVAAVAVPGNPGDEQ